MSIYNVPSRHGVRLYPVYWHGTTYSISKITETVAGDSERFKYSGVLCGIVDGAHPTLSSGWGVASSGLALANAV